MTKLRGKIQQPQEGVSEDEGAGADQHGDGRWALDEAAAPTSPDLDADRLFASPAPAAAASSPHNDPHASVHGSGPIQHGPQADQALATGPPSVDARDQRLADAIVKLAALQARLRQATDGSRSPMPEPEHPRRSPMPEPGHPPRLPAAALPSRRTARSRSPLHSDLPRGTRRRPMADAASEGGRSREIRHRRRPTPELPGSPDVAMDIEEGELTRPSTAASPRAVADSPGASEHQPSSHAPVSTPRGNLPAACGTTSACSDDSVNKHARKVQKFCWM